MIPETIKVQILETARIEEVVDEFLTLKKRGANYVALCPFHTEKTPSFNVNPSRNIFKCFGCGEAGDPARFLMKHEHYSFPEALRYLAEKYNIEIPEAEPDPEAEAKKDRREALHIVNSFARDFFVSKLFEDKEGQHVGLAYLKERGYREQIIKKFELGYCPDKSDDFTQTALKKQHQLEYLKELGLTKVKDNQPYDFFRGRVIFPIHNLSGKVIGFAGRSLRSDARAKYMNSPESMIYNKREVLYGLCFAKQAIRKQEECLLVEGYTDVITMHQAGIEHVVATSGTSLTVEQIRLIKRHTPNLTILFDGDEAGLRAAFRGIDLILEQDMDVKVATLPPKADPDSYVKKLGGDEFLDWLNKEKQNFILFKARHLLHAASSDDGKADPLQKAEATKAIVQSIGRMPDRIKREVLIQSCSQLLELSEQALHTEVNRVRKQLRRKDAHKEARQEAEIAQELETDPKSPRQGMPLSEEVQEKDLIRLLLMFGDKEIVKATPESEVSKDKQAAKENAEAEPEKIKVAAHLVYELNDVELTHDTFRKIWKIYTEAISKNKVPDTNFFVQHEHEAIRKIAIDLTTSPHELSHNWYDKHDIIVKKPEDNLQKDVNTVVAHLRLKKVEVQIRAHMKAMKEAKDQKEEQALVERCHELREWKRKLCGYLGTVVAP